MKAIIIKSLLAAALLVPFTAGAVPISGQINIGGTIEASCDGGATGGCDLNNADAVIFTTPGLVTLANGDFSGIAFGTAVAMTNFVFDPFGGVDPLWSVGGFSFALNSLSVDTQNSSFLNLSGSGMLSGAGFDNTLGNWSFSADGTSGVTMFSWSSTTIDNPVTAPEPGILVLMGLGLIGGLGARRLTRRS